MATVATNKTSTDLPQHDDLEKPNVHHDEIITSMSASEQKRLIRRIDIRLVITLGFLYCISLLDRTNMGATSVAGMQKDLNMNAANNGYSITSLVFFITYTIFQIPATAIIRKIGPRIFISTIVLLWGAVMIAFGFAPTWPVMAGLRIILGALEAGFYPGCIFLLSTWYPRYELQKRNAVFYLIGSMASGLGGILAYGLMQMDGISGRRGWEWIFIVSLLLLLENDSHLLLSPLRHEGEERYTPPQSWNFLNESEAAFIVARLEADRSDVYSEPFSLKSYLANAADSKVWAYSLLYLLTTTNTYSIAFFLPIILQDSMGFSVAKAQCLVAPPYVAAALVMFVQAVFADKWRIRGPVVAFNAAIGLVGLALTGYLESPAPSNNIRGQWKRAFTSATLIGGGSIGGIFGTTVFRAKDAPNYRPGLLATMLANAAIILIVAAMSFKFSRANKRAEGGGKIIEGLSGFRYTL
ncbi:phthalate transporter [Penicillium waksmanii]|uniref:phthalate transporter n=1 Tax=Penicillium waksmanii TaxID=69791 RepID=UPI0025493D18|nr:phthalate transporter [Penicillium waksmanii]KAJ5995538.1 phthalate transporter [Penicillium waksmanii]